MTQDTKPQVWERWLAPLAMSGIQRAGVNYTFLTQSLSIRVIPLPVPLRLQRREKEKAAFVTRPFISA